MTTFTSILISDIIHAKDSHVPAWLSTPIEFKTDEDGWLAQDLLTATYSNTQPVTENPSTYTAVKMLSFVDDFYNRVIYTPSVLAIGNVISSQIRTIDVFNGYFIAKQLTNLTLTNGGGINVSGPSVPSNWGPLQSQQYQITVSVDGPANISALLNFDWSGIADYSLPIAGIRTVSLPYQAEAPWTEILEWKTNVLVNNDGSEQRIRIRNAPRQSFNASYPLGPEEIARSVNIVYSWLARRWAIPVWSEVQVVASIPAATTVINIDTTTVDIREGSLIGLWSSNATTEVIEVFSITSSSVTLSTQVQQTHTNAIVYPVRIGRVGNNGVQRTSNGYNSTLEVLYEVFDNKALTVSTPTQYLNYDVYTDESLFDSSNKIDDSFVTRAEVIDYGSGVVEQYSPWRYNRTARTYRALKQGSSEIWEMKQWLHRRAGKLRPFWLPTFENNFRIKHTGQITSAVRVWADDYRTLGSDHNHIAIKLRSGVWHTRQITGTSIVDATTIDVAFNGSSLSVDATEVMLLSFLTLKRLDTDRVEIEHIGNNTARYAIRIVEISP